MLSTKQTKWRSLDKWFLNKLYADLNQEYYGLSKEDNLRSNTSGHAFHTYYNYYVYQYSTGFAAASALLRRLSMVVKEDRDRYIDYLKAGKLNYPLNVMRKAGVDMEKEDLSQRCLCSLWTSLERVWSPLLKNWTSLDGRVL